MIVTLSSPRLQAQVSADGAELVRLQDQQGRDLLWDGDPAFWTGRSPLLFPIVGRVRNDRIRVDGSEHELPKHGFARTSRFGSEHELPKHGFARTSRFQTVETHPTRCLFRLHSNETTLRQYPFPFRLDVAYAIEADTLTMMASVTGTGASAMPVSFGFHPAFRWPLPYGASREAHEIHFEHEEPAPIRRPVDGLLGRQADPSPVQGRKLALHDSLFVADAIVFDQLNSRSVVYGAPGSDSIHVGFPEMPHLGIWTKPGSGFICIEPWQGHADPEGFEGELASKPGMLIVQPGETKTFTMTITINSADA